MHARCHWPAAMIVFFFAAGCSSPERGQPGDPKAGQAAMERHQCGACHVIPGVADAFGKVGPPLTAYAYRVYLAGKYPQDPELLARWIRNAPSFDPRTAMPSTDVTEGEARDIVAYLSRLR
jgi:cytochrome c